MPNRINLIPRSAESVATPSDERATMFLDQDDGTLKLRLSDGSLVEVGSGGEGGIEFPATITATGADDANASIAATAVDGQASVGKTATTSGSGQADAVTVAEATGTGDAYANSAAETNDGSAYANSEAKVNGDGNADASQVAEVLGAGNATVATNAQAVDGGANASRSAQVTNDGDASANSEAQANTGNAESSHTAQTTEGTATARLLAIFDGAQAGLSVVHDDQGAVALLIGLPTADPVVANALWNDGGTLKISAG